MKVVCVDPGITSVGIAVCRPDGSIDVDLASMKSVVPSHIHVCISDFFRRYAATFDDADVIVIEKQPYLSAGAPLELMFRERFGPRCVFVCPQTLHKYFGTAGYEYDARKAHSVSIAVDFLKKHGEDRALAYIDALTRRHDVCDAILLLMYWQARLKPVEEIPAATTPFRDFVEQFRWRKQ